MAFPSTKTVCPPRPLPAGAQPPPQPPWLCVVRPRRRPHRRHRVSGRQCGQVRGPRGGLCFSLIWPSGSLQGPGGSALQGTACRSSGRPLPPVDSGRQPTRPVTHCSPSAAARPGRCRAQRKMSRGLYFQFPAQDQPWPRVRTAANTQVAAASCFSPLHKERDTHCMCLCPRGDRPSHRRTVTSARAHYPHLGGRAQGHREGQGPRPFWGPQESLCCRACQGY